ncbi:MAG: RNA 2',3'-cyclic phosphodiesterase [Hyphomonadaceae bacterium]|nr:RNA 2',3'-cyclic phosphodiesterase [Hyphomonadaceae bacterium]
MSATDRLFFALFPTATTAAQVYSLQQDLRVRHGLWGRPLAMDRLHVTLAHLGDYPGLPQAVVAKASEAASRVKAPSFEVTFDSALSFAGRARNRPFVLRSKQGAASVEAFQRQLGVEMAACGLGRFVRPYTPHMTLLYDTADVAEHAIDPVTWTVAEFRLVHSLLGQTRHVTLGNWSLGETQAAQRELERAD